MRRRIAEVEYPSGAARDPVPPAVARGDNPHGMGPQRGSDRAVALRIAEGHHLAGGGDEPVPSAVRSRRGGHHRVRQQSAPGATLVAGVAEGVHARVRADQPVALVIGGGHQCDDGSDEVGAEHRAVVGGAADWFDHAVCLGQVVGELRRRSRLRAHARPTCSDHSARGTLGGLSRLGWVGLSRASGAARAHRSAAEPQRERDRDDRDQPGSARAAPATHDRCHCQWHLMVRASPFASRWAVRATPRSVLSAAAFLLRRLRTLRVDSKPLIVTNTKL